MLQPKPEHAPDSPSRCAFHSIAEQSHGRIGQADSLAVGQMANLRIGQVGNVPRTQALHTHALPKRVTLATWQDRETLPLRHVSVNGMIGSNAILNLVSQS